MKQHLEANSTKPVYTKYWSDKLYLLFQQLISSVDSDGFVEKDTHTNNQRNPFPARSITPKFVEANAYNIHYSFMDELVGEMNDSE